MKQYTINTLKQVKILYSLSKKKDISLAVKSQIQQLQKQEQKLIDETDLQKGKEQFFSPDLPQKELQSVQIEQETYVEDYTKSQTKTIVQPEGDSFVAEIKAADGTTTIKWNKTTSQQLDLRTNALALQIISEGQIDFSDPRIQVSNLRAEESIGQIIGEGLKEINLGRIEVLSENTINVRDVDVYNIPDDIDISLDQSFREVRAIGVANQDGSDQGKIEPQIIEDISLDQLKEKYLYNFEYQWLVLDKGELLKKIIRRIPFYILFFAFFDTVVQVYNVREEVSKMEDQEYQPLQKYFQQKEILLSLQVEQLNRSKILKQSEQQIQQR